MSARNKAVSAYEAHVQEGVLLNANESPTNFDEQILTEIKASLDTTLFHRYPDDSYRSLKEAYAQVVGVEPDMVLCGNGSDQMLGLLIGCAMAEGKTLATLAPDFGMYDYYVSMYGGTIKKYPIAAGKPLDMDAFVAFAKDADMVLFSNPNNPTGNAFDPDTIVEVARRFNGITVVDEAYIDFSPLPSTVSRLAECPRLIVMQTLSKAWAGAALRLGIAFASAEIVDIFNKVKYPYNINVLTQREALRLLDAEDHVRAVAAELSDARDRLTAELVMLVTVEHVYPSAANFLLVKVADPDGLYAWLRDRGIIVRNRNRVNMCSGCLRITVGSESENELLLQSLKEYDTLRN